MLRFKEYLEEGKYEDEIARIKKERTIVKTGKKIDGFVWTDKGGKCWYAFGKPSQSNYLAFACKSKEDGIKKIKDLSSDAKEIFK